MESSSRKRSSSLSYKFQRLRERLREAIQSGELKGKLPGERVLAKRFHVNSKTLSKALTDLAAEGLLDRSIGRGTYVKGAEPKPAAEGRWMLLSDATSPDWYLIEEIQKANPQSQVVIDTASMRPSFLNQFTAVVDFARNTPEEFLRSLVVRNIPVVMVGREARVFSMHSVMVDRALGASYLGRDLILGGHRRFAAVEDKGRTDVTGALRMAVARYAPDATVDTCGPSEVGALVEHGVTAIICDSASSAKSTVDLLQSQGIDVPGRVSVAAVGWIEGAAPTTGYFVRAALKIQAILGLIRDVPTGRPAPLWLAGEYIDTGTIAPLSIHTPKGSYRPMGTTLSA